MPEAEWKAWVAQVRENPLEPDLPICDPHHHLWLDDGHTGWPYPLADFLAHVQGSGHNIVHTVFLECNAEYRDWGPEHLRCVGEMEFVAPLAEESAAAGGAEIAGLVGHADLALGNAVEEVVVALEAAARGRLRGVRYSTHNDDYPPLATSGNVPMDHPGYRAGVATVGALGHTYDVMAYHPQLPDLVAVARACPDTPIVINHLGGILGVGPYKNRRDEILTYWRTQMGQLAACPNTYLKVGGIGMPMMGIRWDRRSKPPTSEELAEPWTDPLRYAIDTFGPERCMFESNYPVDMRGAGYGVLWNAYKRIAAPYSADEKRNLFHDAAARAYRLPVIGA